MYIKSCGAVCGKIKEPLETTAGNIKNATSAARKSFIIFGTLNVEKKGAAANSPVKRVKIIIKTITFFG